MEPGTAPAAGRDRRSELAPGQVISFTVGLNEDDNGGSRDDHMIWLGTSTNSQSDKWGAVQLSGVPNTPTPTPIGGPLPTHTPTPTATPTSHPYAVADTDRDADSHLHARGAPTA